MSGADCSENNPTLLRQKLGFVTIKLESKDREINRLKGDLDFKTRRNDNRIENLHKQIEQLIKDKSNLVDKFYHADIQNIQLQRQLASVTRQYQELELEKDCAKRESEHAHSCWRSSEERCNAIQKEKWSLELKVVNLKHNAHLQTELDKKERTFHGETTGLPYKESANTDESGLESGFNRERHIPTQTDDTLQTSASMENEKALELEIQVGKLTEEHNTLTQEMVKHNDEPPITQNKNLEQVQTIQKTYKSPEKDVQLENTNVKQERMFMQNQLYKAQQIIEQHSLHEEYQRQLQTELKTEKDALENMRQKLDYSQYRLNELSDEKTTYSNENVCLKDEIKGLTETNEEMNTKLETKLAREEQLLAKFNTVMNTSKKELDNANTTIAQLEHQLHDIKEKTNTLQEELTDCRDDKKQKELTLLESQRKLQQDHEEVLRAIEDDNEKWKKDYSDLQKQLKDVLFASHETQFALKKQLELTTSELGRSRQESDDSKTSKLMGHNMTEYSPNIADLSDTNRPTKMAERYTELYDNQWTDAFEIIDQGNEIKTVETLQEILHDTSDFCMHEASSQMEQLRKAVLMANGEDVTDVPDFVNKQLNDCRKATTKTSVNNLYEKYEQSLSAQTPSKTWANAALKVPSYLRECFDICWLMSIQDPPVVLARISKHGDRFDSDVYKAYTNTGPHVEYTVWPALYLFEGGAILCKGVAQGYI